MMTNLFSIFDPSTNNFLSLNWLSMMLMYFYTPMLYWLIPSRYIMIITLIFMFMMNEMKMLMLKKSIYINTIMMVSLFNYIFFNNMLSLFPYVFASTSHMLISMSLSFSIWLSIMMFMILKKNKNMFIHLTPQGTPTLLMPFMVVIETISMFIRPLTLSIRLSANIIAGHLLMTLISSSMNKMMLLLTMISIILQSTLMMLELSISFIQAYVFSILSTLYSSEI